MQSKNVVSRQGVIANETPLPLHDRPMMNVRPDAGGRRAVLRIAMFAVVLISSGCQETPIVRSGARQERIVSRVYPIAMRDLRTLIQQRYASAQHVLPDAFRVLKLTDAPPPGFGPEWLTTYTDPGSYLDPYRKLPQSERANDLVLREGTEDKYWLSEYQTNDDVPVLFRCGLVLHFIERAPKQTELQVYEVLPTVFVGKHWEWAKEGIGFGRHRDIRFVLPTMRERQAVLALVDTILKDLPVGK